MPNLATAASLGFIWAYDAFLCPLISLNGMEFWTVPLARTAFIDFWRQRLYGAMLAMKGALKVAWTSGSWGRVHPFAPDERVLWQP